MYKPKYFTITELTVSATAKSYGINNEPSEEHRKNLILLCEHVLDPVREMWGAPIYVNSGYRSQALNNKLLQLGSHCSIRSQHMVGLAADIRTTSTDGNMELFNMIKESEIPFCKMIDEEGYRWIHISYDPLTSIPRRQVFRGRSGVYTVVK